MSNENPGCTGKDCENCNHRRRLEMASNLIRSREWSGAFQALPESIQCLFRKYQTYDFMIAQRMKKLGINDCESEKHRVIPENTYVIRGQTFVKKTITIPNCFSIQDAKEKARSLPEYQELEKRFPTDRWQWQFLGSGDGMLPLSYNMTIEFTPRTNPGLFPA